MVSEPQADQTPAPVPPPSAAPEPAPAATAQAAPATPATPAVPAPPHEPVPGPLATRRLPPIAEVAVAVMAIVLAGGIYLAAYLPRHAPLTPAVVLLAVAGVLLLGNVVQLGRLEEFAWHRFFQVSKWAMAAYVVIAGMIEYVFVYDGTRGAMLAVMTAMILIFAVDIPMLLGFSVARYQEPRRLEEPEPAA